MTRGASVHRLVMRSLWSPSSNLSCFKQSERTARFFSTASVSSAQTTSSSSSSSSSSSAPSSKPSITRTSSTYSAQSASGASFTFHSVPIRRTPYPPDVPAHLRKNSTFVPYLMQSPSRRREKGIEIAAISLSPNHKNDITHLTPDPSFVPTRQRPWSWIRPVEPTVTPVPWTIKSKRMALIARKIGMMHLWDHYGQMIPVSVVRVEDCFVIGYNHTLNKAGEMGVKLSAGHRKVRNFSKSEIVEYKKAGVYPGMHKVMFRCTPDAVLPVGYQLTATHFVPGQYVDVAGMSLGRGYQGPMRRWNFGGLPATHGVSVSHRSHGSVGSAQDPGRVFRGKKMAGQWGNERITVLNLQVYKVDTIRNLIYIKGAIPSASGKWVEVRDAIKKQFDPRSPPPFPTFIPKKDQKLPSEIIMAHPEEDPFAYGELV